MGNQWSQDPVCRVVLRGAQPCSRVARLGPPGLAELRSRSTGLRPGTTSEDKAGIAELERENRELRRSNGILSTVPHFD